ncbi:MAG TPA: DUF3078 domain-containing protein [Bacteroidia bacterium]|nr:DUF3078 domain-containing protein [Bacteroidia bacterium]
MKRLLFLFLLFPFLLHAQSDTVPDSVWHRGAFFGFNFTQASFTNWAAGGVNSISGQAFSGGFVRYKKDSTSWENTLELAYGLLQQGGRTKLRKTDDRIDFTSKSGIYAFKRVWYYSALIGFRTQFSPGYTYPGDTAQVLISDFMSPAYLVAAVGLDYKPNKYFSLLIAPVTGRSTFVTSQTLANQGAFGVKKAVYDSAGLLLVPGEKVRHEFGGYVRATFKKEVMKNVTVAWRCELFTNYLKDPQNIDVNTEMNIGMKVNKFITVSLKMQAIYDNDINVPVDENRDGISEGVGPRLQFAQLLGVGFLVKL